MEVWDDCQHSPNFNSVDYHGFYTSASQDFEDDDVFGIRNVNFSTEEAESEFNRIYRDEAYGRMYRLELELKILVVMYGMAPDNKNQDVFCES